MKAEIIDFGMVVNDKWQSAIGNSNIQDICMLVRWDYNNYIDWVIDKNLQHIGIICQDWVDDDSIPSAYMANGPYSLTTDREMIIREAIQAL